MLVYVNLVGGLSEKLCVVIEPDAKLGAVRDAVFALRPHVANDAFRFMPFAGHRVLPTDLERTLSALKIQKECTVQCYCTVDDQGAPSHVHAAHAHAVGGVGSTASAQLVMSVREHRKVILMRAQLYLPWVLFVCVV